MKNNYSKLKVLILDDEPTALQFAIAALVNCPDVSLTFSQRCELAKSYFEIISFTKLSEAQKYVKYREVPDIAIIDANLEKTSESFFPKGCNYEGLEFAKYLQDNYPDLPIVIFTQYANIKEFYQQLTKLGISKDKCTTKDKEDGGGILALEMPELIQKAASKISLDISNRAIINKRIKELLQGGINNLDLFLNQEVKTRSKGVFELKSLILSCSEFKYSTKEKRAIVEFHNPVETAAELLKYNYSKDNLILSGNWKLGEHVTFISKAIEYYNSHPNKLQICKDLDFKADVILCKIVEMNEKNRIGKTIIEVPQYFEPYRLEKYTINNTLSDNEVWNRFLSSLVARRVVIGLSLLFRRNKSIFNPSLVKRIGANNDSALIFLYRCLKGTNTPVNEITCRKELTMQLGFGIPKTGSDLLKIDRPFIFQEEEAWSEKYR